MSQKSNIYHLEFSDYELDIIYATLNMELLELNDSMKSSSSTEERQAIKHDIDCINSMISKIRKTLPNFVFTWDESQRS